MSRARPGDRAPGTGTRGDLARRDRFTLPGKVAAVLVVVATLMLLVVRFGALRDRLGASRLVAVAEGLTAATATRGDRLSRQVLETNLLRLRRAAELDPYEVTVPIALGGQYVLLGRPEAAERAYLSAVEIEDRAEIWANLVQVYRGQGEVEKAMGAAQRAVALDGGFGRYFSDLQRRRRARGETTVASPMIFVDSFESGTLDAWTVSGTSGSDDPSAVSSDQER
ncbi:MAG: hypothetical protein AAGC60_06615 [Acidobacteriota bacterium]